MTLFTVIIAIVIALFFSLIFSYVFKNRGPWSSLWTFFLILFLAVWAGGLWLAPVGPYWHEISIVPLIFIGLLFALLLAAATPPATPSPDIRKTGEEIQEKNKAAAAVGLFFWILLVALIAAIIVGLLI